MIRALILCLSLAALVAPAAQAQRGLWPEDDTGEQTLLVPLRLREVVRLVEDRFDGRILGAALLPARPNERGLGAVLVFELRWLTPDRDLLHIRVDAVSGRFLEVAGQGIADARKKHRKKVDDL